MVKLLKVYKQLQEAIEKGFKGGLNAIVIVGSTGSGKSTIINSLIYGSNILYENDDKIEIKDEFA